jgi:hypothetical protein
MNLNPKWWLWTVTGMNLIAKRTLLRLATLQALRVNKSRSLSSICFRWNIWLGSMVIVHTSSMCKGQSKHTLVPIEWVNNLKIHSSQLAMAWKTAVCLSFSMSKGLSKHTSAPIKWVNNLKIHSSQFALAWKRESACPSRCLLYVRFVQTCKSTSWSGPTPSGSKPNHCTVLCCLWYTTMPVRYYSDSSFTMIQVSDESES